MWIDLVKIGGVNLPALLAFVGLAVIIHMPLRWLLHRLRCYRSFWHPALAEAALFASILSLVTLGLGP